MTHEAPYGVLDMTGGGHWGSSHDLLEAIYRVKPKVHLFGHIHEQRGHWDKAPRRGFRGPKDGFWIGLLWGSSMVNKMRSPYPYGNHSTVLINLNLYIFTPLYRYYESMEKTTLF